MVKISKETNCEIYLEPGEAVVLDAGILVGEIIDTFKPNNNFLIIPIMCII